MAEYREPPDVEALLVEYLKADVDLDALVDGRVSTELPKEFTAQARVKLFLVSMPELDEDTGYIHRARVQYDTYGATPKEAFDVAAKTRKALRFLVDADLEGAVVTKVIKSLGPSWQPDPDTDAPHYLNEAIITLHAIDG